MLQRTGADGQGTLITQANLGIVEYRTGQLADAVQELTQVHSRFAQLFGESSPQAQSVAFYLACALAGLGRDSQASVLAGGLDAAGLAAAEPRDDWPQRLQALKGEILLDQGRFAEAAGQLEPAVVQMEREQTPAWVSIPSRRRFSARGSCRERSRIDAGSQWRRLSFVTTMCIMNRIRSRGTAMDRQTPAGTAPH